MASSSPLLGQLDGLDQSQLQICRNAHMLIELKSVFVFFLFTTVHYSQRNKQRIGLVGEKGARLGELKESHFSRFLLVLPSAVTGGFCCMC